MADLIVCLVTGKAQIHASELIEQEKWNRIFVIAEESEKNNLKVSKNVEFIIIDSRKTLSELTKEIKSKLAGKISGLDVAVNFFSGTGKEHMAMVSAVLQLGFGIRLVAATQGGVKEI